MKKLLFITLLLLLTTSCSKKGNSVPSDYVVDTTLTIDYPDAIGEISYIPKHWSGGEVPTAEIAYKVVEPSLIRALGRELMNSEKPFRINLVDSIWIIRSTFPEPIITKDYMDWGGMCIYMEIRKSNGEIVKSILEK